MQEENKVKKGFRQNMKAELKKVIWPTGKQVRKSTSSTISFVLLISIILVILNYAFSFINSKWFDLVLGKENNPNQQNELNVVTSGDKSGDSTIIEETVSGEIESGEINVTNENVESGDENIVTE